MFRRATLTSASQYLQQHFSLNNPESALRRHKCVFHHLFIPVLVSKVKATAIKHIQLWCSVLPRNKAANISQLDGF